MPHIDIVFDGPPSHESGRFVEVENADGKSIKAGEWIERPDGFWALRLPSHANLMDALEAIARGNFSGASTLAVTGDWHGIVDRLQEIARNALVREIDLTS